MKILGHLQALSLEAEPGLRGRVLDQGYRAKPERVFKLKLEAFDWNCPQHITPRFTDTEVAAAEAPLRAWLADLEAENARLRAELAGAGHEGERR